MASTDCPKILDSKNVFSGRVFNVSVDTIREGDKTYQREDRSPSRKRRNNPGF